MLQLKDQLHTFLRCSIGDGNTALFWHDYWTELGPLHQLFGPTGPRSLRIPLNANVSRAVSNGHWSIPSARSEDAVTLQIILSTTVIPSSSNRADVFLWRNSSGGFGPSFSSRVTWERLRVTRPQVPWYSVVWFKEEIPRCSFISWTAFLGRLPTRDRLISWGLSVPPGCVLCSLADESVNHLFFQCPFAVATWSRFCGRYMASPPSSLADVVLLCQQLPGPHASRAVVVLKLINQVIVYTLWRERNSRIFSGVSSSQEACSRLVDRAVRDRLLSLTRPTATAPSPSLLELFFWFVSPFS
ncbi:uncharacterized protein LOC108815453 [Raphanus sativus]|uniref:Uncharacterized protein LOC108815453 n=1 Tax=Raphanus sativus TaxID=3726 RepID=A0A6J0K9A3_RAPSA|nr:uncharacterized protein LOC108815453 [Raphanus sativus]